MTSPGPAAPWWPQAGGQPATATAAAAAPAQPTPVLWLYGPGGVGKTTVGWQIFTELKRIRVAAAYVDIDQLGICYPEQPSDPGRHSLQARNLGAVVANFAAAGARTVIVSGVVDSVRGIQADLVPGAALVGCRLRADAAELERRVLGRSGDLATAADAVREAATFDASHQAGLCINTTTSTATDVASEVVRRCGGWSALIGPRRPAAALALAGAETTGAKTTGAHLQVLLLCGATGAGKSTVGFEIYLRAVRAGHVAAYVDLDQVGFCYPADDDGNHELKVANLGALCANYRAAGARLLVVVGPVDSERAAARYADALPAATITLCRLHASDGELALRISARGQGGSWPQPGDPLVGQSAAVLRHAAEQAARDAAELERAAIGVRVVTDGRSVTEVADLVVSQPGWPGGPG